MIKIEAVDVWGFKYAIRGMRNPMNSWDKSDTVFCNPKGCYWCPYVEKCKSISVFYPDLDFRLGNADLDLMHRLFIGGTEHRKFMRCLHISMDVTAPLYWWKEYDTYKVSTVANSCSTMHKIHAKEFTLDDFSHEHLTEDVSCKAFLQVIEALNFNRDMFLETKDKKWWWNMIQLLPSSYNQKRTLDFNYETAVQIIRQRTGHKLDEWHKFVDVLWDLPYMREIVGDQDEQK
jgi:hypothetical protein